VGADVRERGGVMLYRYAWGNNPKRAQMKGRTCHILWTLALGSVLIEFTDNGQREVTSRRALRRVPERGKP